MTGPFPVVSITPKLTHTFRRCAYKANVSITLVHKCKELVAFKQSTYPCFNILSGITQSFIDSGQYGALLLQSFSSAQSF